MEFDGVSLGLLVSLLSLQIGSFINKVKSIIFIIQFIL